MDLTYLYTSTEGRIGRKDFWIGVLGFVVVGAIIGLVIGWIVGMQSGPGQILMFIVQLIFAYPSYALLAKRFQDRDKPATYAFVWVGVTLLYSLLGLLGITGEPSQPNGFGLLLSLIFLVAAVWVLIETGFLRGTIGPNQYGPDPVAQPRSA